MVAPVIRIFPFFLIEQFFFPVIIARIIIEGPTTIFRRAGRHVLLGIFFVISGLPSQSFFGVQCNVRWDNALMVDDAPFTLGVWTGMVFQFIIHTRHRPWYVCPLIQIIE
jgi:hypothetical protein